eukprot:TRINITY_DN236_c0_g1_i1.p1 TRINITY_DN236_c0_g1~~TRINITY_DN236_c0_g1_i1.p1  ORF type:complete len:198 (+),score=49.18 TRINITY_DN236_c0_g1_i1:872-1465(+)
MGAHSVKGLVLMETIYPSTDGRTVFDDPKLAQQLAKEIKKGTVRLPTKSDEVDVDEDIDSKLVGCVSEVWSFYDQKNTGAVEKKAGVQFFKDALELYATRKGQKPRDVAGQGVNLNRAIDECYNKMSGNQPRVTKQQFENYIYCHDLDEALAPCFGQSGLTIQSRLPTNMMFDPNTLPKEATSVDMTQIKYRDYGTD